MDLVPDHELASGRSYGPPTAKNDPRDRATRGGQKKIDFFSEILKTDGDSKETSGDIK